MAAVASVALSLCRSVARSHPLSSFITLLCSCISVSRPLSHIDRQRELSQVQVEDTEELLREFEAKYLAIRRVCMTRAAAGAAGGLIAAHDRHEALAGDDGGQDMSHAVVFGVPQANRTC